MASWVPPDQFEEYQIVDVLGSGGMGHVYRARDTMLERDVAIKFMAGEGAEQVSERFLREARAAARIQHPNVAAIYRVASVDNRLCLVSELVSGRPLSSVPTPAPWRQVLGYALDLARGLAAAHAKGIVHRDIKPSNLMLTDGGDAKLIDFGLAKLLGVEEPASEASETPPSSDLTRDGAVLGTPYYIAPETWRGQEATPQTDLWSLGAVLYELCAGLHPYADIAVDELAEVIREPRPLAEVVTDIDGGFAALVDSCLAIDPERRASSAAELATALQAIAGDPGDARGAEAVIAAIEERGRVLVLSSDAERASTLCRQYVLPALDDTAVIARLDAEPVRRLTSALATSLDADAVTLDDVDPFDVKATAVTSSLDQIAAGEKVTLLLDRVDRLDDDDTASVAKLLEGLDGRPVRVIATSAPSGIEKLDRLGTIGEELRGSRVDLDGGVKRWPLFVGGAAVLAIVVGVWAWPRSDEPIEDAAKSPEPPAVTTTVRPFLVPGTVRRLTLDEGCEEYPWWTPDSKAVVFDATYDGGFALFRRELGTTESVRLTPGKVWNFAPAVSPDGEMIAFTRRDESGELSSHVMSKEGTGEVKVGAGRLRPSWSLDGSGLWIGDAAKPTLLARGTWTVTRTISAPKDSILFRVRELEDGRLVALAYPEDATSSAKGIVLYAKGQDSDPRWLWQVKGEEVLAIGPGGAVYGARKSLAGPGELWRMNLDGGEPELVVAAGAAPTLGMNFSPDGKRLAWSDCGFEQRLANLTDVGDGKPMRAIPISRTWNDWEAVSIPRSDQLVMISDRSGSIELWVAGGAAAARRLPTPDLTPGSVAVSPDAKQIAFMAEDKGLYVMPLDGSAAPSLVLAGKDHFYPVFSHDGAALFFQTENNAGEARIGVVSTDGGEVEVPFERSAGEPAVSADGSQVAYLLEVDAGAELSVPMIWSPETREHRRIASSALEPGWYHHVRFSSDGKRLVVLQGGRIVREIDLDKDEVVRTFHSGERQLTGATYVGDEILVGLSGWVGGIWTADVQR